MAGAGDDGDARDDGGGDDIGRGDDAGDWDPGRYDAEHGFVYRYGEDVLDLLAPGPGERVLDLGCGTGHLTAKIEGAGAGAVGLDRSLAMLAEARRAYPDLALVHGDARSIPLGPVDAVFSNAALHWIPGRDQATVADAVWGALRPGGRFVAELGGAGNVGTIRGALSSALSEAGYPVPDPWYFPTVGEHASLLEERGFRVTYARLFDRPTELEGGRDGLRGWLSSFAGDFLDPVPGDERGALVGEVEDALEPALYDGDAWTADYVRLRIVARRPAR